MEDSVCQASWDFFVNNEETIILILIPKLLPSLKQCENQLTVQY